MNWWTGLAAHILISIAVFAIALKSEHQYSWLAFIPIANLWLMVDMADAPLWTLLLFLLPWLNILVYVWLWMKIAENTNKSQWLGILMIVPVVNVITALYMAFYEPEEIRA